MEMTSDDELTWDMRSNALAELHAKQAIQLLAQLIISALMITVLGSNPLNLSCGHSNGSAAGDWIATKKGAPIAESALHERGLGSMEEP